MFTARPRTRLRSGHQVHIAQGTQQLETPQYAIVYFIRGEGALQIGKKHYPFKAGSVMQRFPNQLHQVHFYQECESVFAAVPAPSLQVLKTFNLPTLQEPVFDVGIDQLFIDRFIQLGKELWQRLPQHQVQVAGQILQLIIDVHLRAQSSSEESQEQFIHNACTILQSNFDQDMHLPAIAEELGMSYINFRKRFKQHTGMSPGQFRIQQRIEIAKQHLLQGKSINDCAEELGYPDCYTFSKQFKKITGYPPREYVKRQGLDY